MAVPAAVCQVDREGRPGGRELSFFGSFSFRPHPRPPEPAPIIMKPTTHDFDDAAFGIQDTNASLASDDDSTAIALVELEDQENGKTAEWTGPRCEKCAAPLRSDGIAICRSCGWYGSLNTFVEVDPNWQTEADQDSKAETRPQKSHARVWFELIPWWGWVIVGSLFVVVAESVAARFVTEYGSSSRTTWSLVQLAIGVFAAIICHIVNFLVQVADDPDVGLFDVVLKPVKLWLNTLSFLPTRLWVVDAAASGLVAAFMSIAVIGGIPYDRLWDWGFTPPAKQELMGAVMDRVKQIDNQGADNLEDAIGDFAGKGELEDDQKVPEKPRKTADCVILGYTLDNAGRLNTLVLGTAHLGKLVYAGNVTPKMDNPQELRNLQKKLTALQSQQRTLPIQTEANWVRPSLTCRVTYGERQTTGRLNDVQWQAFLGSMRTPNKAKR